MAEQSEAKVKQYKIGNRTVFDMRDALSGFYQDTGLKPGDCVIWSDKKVYRTLKNTPGKGATFIKMTNLEIQQLTEEVKLAITHYSAEEKREEL